MIANYHTHTPRCNHAVGTEEEYVLAAIQRGMHILGFADHSPCCGFPDGYYSGFRMKPDETPGYASAILDLRERYHSQIQLYPGVEMEYYPAYFHETLSMLRDSGVEYLILGQHFINNEIGEKYNGQPTDDEERLRQYCRQVMDGMNTGLFSYVAHPDVFNFTGAPAVYQKHFRELCREARSCGLPLEINLLGLGENRHYPNTLFWQVAAEEGCNAVLGCDAHKPEALLDVATADRAYAMAKQLGLTVVDTVPLKII